MASGGHASSPSFLSWYWYMGSWPPFQEGWGSTVCVCMCACAVMAQWEVDDECFWLDNWFAPVFTFNLWWAWSVEGSQSGTVGFNRKRLNGSSKSHRKQCHSHTNAYWEFPLLSLWFVIWQKKACTLSLLKNLWLSMLKFIFTQIWLHEVLTRGSFQPSTHSTLLKTSCFQPQQRHTTT